MFDGDVQLEDTMVGLCIVRNPSQAPLDADSLPTYRIYAGSGLLALAGSLSKLDTGTVTGASNNSPIVVTSAAHGRQTGDRVAITGVLGNTAANNTWTVTRLTADTFSLDNSSGNGAYTSGGEWHMAGVYRYSIDATSGNGFAVAQVYNVVIQATVGGFPFSEVHTFRVV